MNGSKTKRIHFASGYVFIGAVIAVNIFAILILAARNMWEAEITRDLEAEYLFRARQYKTAIELYVKNNNNLYPTNFEDLYKKKFLRKEYKDPLSETGGTMGILELLGLGKGRDEDASSAAAQTEAVRKIAASLERMDRDRARFIAAFAYVLGRVAHADLDISEDETREMERIVREKGHLDEAQAVLVVQIAKSQNVLFGGTQNYVVTREFTEISDREQRLALIDCLFAVSAADGSVSIVEANTIRQIADELKLDHRDYIGVRTTYREFLSELQ